MARTMRMMRNVVFGMMIAGSLGFGASQATASPAKSACDGQGQVPVSSCPADRRCDNICPGGACLQNCCTCPI